MILTRAQFIAHLEEYTRDGGVGDNPEYGGTIIDWVWDWLIRQGTTGPATGPSIRWLQLQSEDLPGKSIFAEVFEELKNIGKEPHAADKTR